jgi:hypothetical protein
MAQRGRMDMEIDRERNVTVTTMNPPAQIVKPSRTIGRADRSSSARVELREVARLSTETV